MNLSPDNRGVAVAAPFHGALDSKGLPGPAAWGKAIPIRFASDWQGQNLDKLRETEVSVFWTSSALFLRFRCRYRTLTIFERSDPDGRRDQLWDRDVAEVFLQPNSAEPRRYWEFEVAPNGMWIDLDISEEGRRDPQSGMLSRVEIDNVAKVWTAELGLPMQQLTPHFDPSAEWRLNFFRVEGAAEPRFYSAWQATHTPQPNFHVPEAFGVLRFQAR